MEQIYKVPDWDTMSDSLRQSLGYSDSTLKRTKYTYNVFVRDYCTLDASDAATVIRQGILKAGDAFESGNISKDKLLRIRRLAFHMLQLLNNGMITWERAPLYGVKYGNDAAEALLLSFVQTEHKEHRHADSIIKRDECIIRQFILFLDEKGITLTNVVSKDILVFLSHMKTLRPAGLQSTASALRHFYLFLIELELPSRQFLWQ